MPKKIIDTHVHIWDFSKARYAWLDGDTTILNRSYAIEELERARMAAGITGGILVQAANNAEDTGWMLQVAAQTGWIYGVVGWLPLLQPDATAQALTQTYTSQPYFKGVRHLIHNEPGSDWLLQPPVMESLAILAKHQLPFDVVGIHTAHLETALQVAEQLPNLRMVFDHLNQPPAGKRNFGRWGELMKAAAQHPQCYVKISGLGTAAGKGHHWRRDDIEPAIAFVLEHFGADRCFCGGDWPVSLLAGDYVTTWQTYQQIITDLLDEPDQDKLFYQNAANFYRL